TSTGNASAATSFTIAFATLLEVILGIHSPYLLVAGRWPVLLTHPEGSATPRVRSPPARVASLPRSFRDGYGPDPRRLFPPRAPSGWPSSRSLLLCGLAETRDFR